MAQSTDLYGLLRGYVLKNSSPVVVIDAFLKFLENYARLRVPEQPDWEKWAFDTETKFWDELPMLIDNEKCVFLAETAEERLYMPFYCLEKLQPLYQNSDTLADRPFPSEESLKVNIPEGQLRTIAVDTGLTPFLENSNIALPPDAEEAEETGDPGQHKLVKIIFPIPYGSALAPSVLIPYRLLESAFLKLRYYLLNHGNREYLLHKITPYFSGREQLLREMFDQLVKRPGDCMLNLQSSGEFSSLFWDCFCSMLKKNIEAKLKDDELLGEEVAAVQAACIIEACNVFYKARTAKKKEVELALRSLDQHLEQPPFYFTLDDIIKFTNDKGAVLLDIYTKEDLGDHIKKRTTEGRKNELPDWLILQDKNHKRWYIKKNKYLSLCAKTLIECRPYVRKEIVNQWLQTLKDFRKEAAMEKDEEFERLLAAHTANLNPTLMMMLEDPKLPLVYSEMERSGAVIPAALRIIKDGRLLPPSALYAFRRKEMLADVKFMLPFWYSIPILVSIIAFFKNRGRRNRQATPAAGNAYTSFESEKEGRAIQGVARGIEAAMVPDGFTRESYLAELESRWSNVPDKQIRQTIVGDVQALLRDNLRYAIKIYRTRQLSRESLGDIADGLIARNPALQRLGNRQALRLYIQLYMVKLLITKT
ncbi:MAG: hypothetical protein LBS37_05470 [Treponema sp.]|jgi:hypothetical protein|nr:hypothetical protein [Treponema sp.]